MLPFLKPKQSSVAGLIIKNRTPDQSSESEQPSRTAEDCAQDLLNAIQSQDKSAIVKAIQDIAEYGENSEPESQEE